MTQSGTSDDKDTVLKMQVKSLKQIVSWNNKYGGKNYFH